MTMRKTRLGIVAVAAAAGALVLAGVPAAAGVHHSHKPMRYTCTGGEIPSGHYASITVKGECAVAPNAMIRVDGNLKVWPHATFDAQSAPSKIFVRGNVFAGRGSLLGLGCQPPSFTGNSAHECAVDPEGHSHIFIKGKVTAINATAVLLNGIRVRGHVRVIGGGDPMIPWSIKNNVFRRNLTVMGQTTEWVGVLFNRVGGTVRLRNITLHDVDPGAPGVYIVQNTIRHNLICNNLSPGVSGGFTPGAVNVVGGRATGQCRDLV